MGAAAGVYLIVCLPKSKAYVGSSANIHNRWSHHKTLLRQGLHPIKSLQRDWQTHGPDSFEWIVLKTIKDKTRREECEARWIQRLNATNSVRGYNKALKGNQGWHQSEAAKQHLSEVSKVRNAQPVYNQMLYDRCKLQHQEGTLNITPESRAKAGNSLKGRVMSEEQKQKLRETALANREKRQEAARKSVEARRKMIAEDPTAKERLYGQNKGKSFTPEHRANMSLAAKKRWQG